MNNTEYEILKEGYSRVSTINKEDMSRLYRFAGAYPAVALGLLTWLLKEHSDLNNVSPVFWSIASIVSSFYIIFYSYISAHLVDSGIYLNTLWQRLNEFHDGKHIPSWDGYTPGIKGGETRWILTYILTSWRILVWSVSLILWWLGFDGSVVTKLISYVALILSIASGATVIASFLYAFNAKRTNYTLPVDTILLDEKS